MMPFERCRCTHERGDSDCAVHPRCPNCNEKLESTALFGDFVTGLGDSIKHREKIAAQAARIAALEEGLREACEIAAPLAETVETTWVGSNKVTARKYGERIATLRALIKP